MRFDGSSGLFEPGGAWHISISYMHSAMGGGAVPQNQSQKKAYNVQLDVLRSAIDTT